MINYRQHPLRWLLLSVRKQTYPQTFCSLGRLKTKLNSCCKTKVDFKKGYHLFPKFIYILKESQYNFLFFVVLAQSFEHQDEFVWSHLGLGRVVAGGFLRVSLRLPGAIRIKPCGLKKDDYRQ